MIGRHRPEDALLTRQIFPYYGVCTCTRACGYKELISIFNATPMQCPLCGEPKFMYWYRPKWEAVLLFNHI